MRPCKNHKWIPPPMPETPLPAWKDIPDGPILQMSCIGRRTNASGHHSGKFRTLTSNPRNTSVNPPGNCIHAHHQLQGNTPDSSTRERKKLPIQGRKRFADHLHGRLGHLVIEAKLSSLMGGFPDNHAVFGNGVHGPCHNLAGSQRGVGRDVSKFRDMQN